MTYLGPLRLFEDIQIYMAIPSWWFWDIQQNKVPVHSYPEHTTNLYVLPYY